MVKLNLKLTNSPLHKKITPLLRLINPHTARKTEFPTKLDILLQITPVFIKKRSH